MGFLGATHRDDPVDGTVADEDAEIGVLDLAIQREWSVGEPSVECDHAGELVWKRESEIDGDTSAFAETS